MPGIPNSDSFTEQFSAAPRARASVHDVAFYENDIALCASVAQFLAGGLQAGEAAIVIATSEHREAIAALLATRGIDIAALTKRGHVTLLDAAETLCDFMSDSMPDPQLFEQRVGSLIAHAIRVSGREHVAAFGEMVDILWRNGNQKAAVRLEQLWNELSRKYSLSLLCAYSIENFHLAADQYQLHGICGEHQDVTTIEASSHSDVRLNEIVFFKQQSEALEREIECRKRAQSDHERVLSSERAARTEAEEQVQQRDEFIAQLSHELLTPLTAILGYASLIKSGRLDPSKIEKAVDSIQRNARWQHQLLEDLRDLSRMNAGTFPIRFVKLVLSDIIRDAVDAVSPGAQAKRLQVQLDLHSLTGDVWGDEVRLLQVVSNVLANAVKFTAEDGLIVVRLQQVGARAEIHVIDNGKGISPEFLPYIFDRFRQEDPRNGGLGLGLSIVKHIVELHGGTVAASSAGPGQGAAFTIQLPVVASVSAT